MDKFYSLLKSIGLGGILILSGCGTYVPAIPEIWEDQGDQQHSPPLEGDIKNRIFCDIKNAILDIYNRHPRLRDEAFLREAAKQDKITFADFGVEVVLTLTVDETSTANPGLAFKTPMIPATTRFPNNIAVTSPQSYALGLGANLSSHATRIDKFNFLYSVAELAKNPRPCSEESFRTGSSLLLHSGDLRISEWLRTALDLAGIAKDDTTGLDVTAAASANTLKRASLIYEVKFNVVSGGSITPTWNLVRVTANPTGKLFDANRERNHDVTISFAPRVAAADIPCPDNPKKTCAKKGDILRYGIYPSRGELTADAQNALLASQIGLAVSNNLRGNLLPLNGF